MTGTDIQGWGKRRAALGQAKLALRFQIPLQASLHGIVKTHRPLAERMALLGCSAAEAIHLRAARLRFDYGNRWRVGERTNKRGDDSE